MMKVHHERYSIEVFSYRAGDKWRPEIRMSRRSGTEVRTEQLLVPETVLFDSPAESDAYGVQIAKSVIDERE
jgi:hypothetical protein